MVFGRNGNLLLSHNLYIDNTWSVSMTAHIFIQMLIQQNWLSSVTSERVKINGPIFPPYVCTKSIYLVIGILFLLS